MDKIMNVEEKAIKLNNKLLSDDCEGMKAQKIAKETMKKIKKAMMLNYFE